MPAVPKEKNADRDLFKAGSIININGRGAIVEGFSLALEGAMGLHRDRKR